MAITQPARRAATHRRRMMVLSLTLLALVVSACGDGAGESTTTTETLTSTTAASPTTEAPGDTSATTPPSEPTTVRLQGFGDFLATAPIFVARDQGYFEDENLIVEDNEPIFNAALVAQAVLEGDAEFGLPGANAPVELEAAGQDIVVVANPMSPFGVQIILGNETVQKLAAEGVTLDSSVDERIAALEGMLLVAPAAGSTTNLMGQRIIESGGLDPTADVTIQPAGDSASMIAAVREGQADGLVGFIDLGAGAEAGGWGTVWVDVLYDDVDEGLRIPHLQLVARPDFVESNPETIAGFVRAIARAKEFLVDISPEELAALKETYFSEMDQATFDLAFELYQGEYAASIVPTPEQHTAVVALVEGDNPGVADVAFEDLYDVTFAEAAENE